MQDANGKMEYLTGIPSMARFNLTIDEKRRYTMARKGEDDNQWAIPSIHVVDDEQLQDSLAHPVPPGGSEPRLNLAESPGFNVASGSSWQAMPDPPRPEITWPSLSGSPDCGGVDHSNPSSPAPDLAGCGGGFSTPASSPILPDYSQPDWGSLNQGLVGNGDDIANAAIHYAPNGKFGPDPMMPDLTSYNHPMGLDFHQTSPSDIFKPDPVTGDLTDPDIPNGIHVLSNPEAPDPSVPDLQNPELELQIKMQGRPGDMDPSALDIMHQSPDYGATKGVSYDLSYMVQPGSSRRSRHMDMLTHGLDGDM